MPALDLVNLCTGRKLRMEQTNQIHAKAILLLITLYLPGILSTGCTHRTPAIHPMVENITASVYASGRVKSNTQYQLYSPVNGLVQKIFVSKGDTVKQNALIMQLQNTAMPINIDNARLSAANAAMRANMDRIKELDANMLSLKNKYLNDSVLYRRQQDLWAAGIGTRNELEQRELQHKNDRAAYDAALFHYNDLKRQIQFGEAQSVNNLKMSRAIAGDYLVRSNLDGKVFDILIKEGEMVMPQTPLAWIGGSRDFMLELQVDEYDITKVHTGQQVLFTMDSYKHKVYEARVRKIIPLMNERTRTFTIEAGLTEIPPVLYPNLTVDANIVTGVKNNVITIPRDYLKGDTMVVLKNGKQQRVITGIMDYTKAEIISGLTKDDILVKPGQ